MTIFVTNIWNHYMTSFCPFMAEKLGEENFRMVLVSPKQAETSLVNRAKMGWKIDLPEGKWVVPNPDTVADLEDGEGIRLIESAEVAIIESLFYNKKLFRAVSRRIRSGKLTFIANERLFKHYVTMWDCLNPKFWRRWLWYHWRFNHKNVHYLPEDHWGRDDMRFVCACKGRIWQFGCFPPVSDKPVEKPMRNELHIGWCGKMLRLKHVDHIIKAVSLLPNDCRNRCRVTIIGEGEHKEELISLVSDLGLDGIVTFKPYQPLEEIKRWMSDLDVYIFPSDIREGWGVVIPEAMDKCCVPIACVDAGVTLDVIDDGYNGFVFEQGDLRRISRKLMWLMDHPAERKEMGLNAWKTMQGRTAENAADRCLAMINAVQMDDYSLAPQEGPFSNIG